MSAQQDFNGEFLPERAASPTNAIESAKTIISAAESRRRRMAEIWPESRLPPPAPDEIVARAFLALVSPKDGR
ncbi:MAG: hypothetical protein KGS44_13190 [Alphaproteobacteria bacterium]|nr:hypothetical protein [Alphaproteobacteria bacterium]